MKTRVKHTPGPWTITEDISTKCGNKRYYHLEGDSANAYIFALDHPGSANPKISEANARLITAAPELLEAAKAVMFARLPGLNFDLERHPDMLLLEAAIHKAEGEST